MSKNAGAYAAATTSGGDVNLSSSANFSDGDATTQRLSSAGTFTAGQGKYSSNTTTSVTLTNTIFTEDEWSLKFAASSVGNTYKFRSYYSDGTPYETYGVTPSMVPVACGNIMPALD